MEFEFDKEIDALLRSSAKSEAAFAENNPQSAIRNPHLDADSIAAFAENALPEKTRQGFVAHFADCERCRTILSNVIASNSESVSIKQVKTVSAAAPIPWYRKLFAYPNLAYGFGALILVFSGLLAFVVLQNNSREAEVSQVAEKQTAEKQTSSDVQSSPNAVSSNDSAFNAASNSNTAASFSTNTTTATAESPNPNAAVNKSASALKPTPKTDSKRGDDAAKSEAEPRERSFIENDAPAETQEKQAKDEKKEAETADATSPPVVAAAPPAPKPEALATVSRSGAAAAEDRSSAKKSKAAPAEKKSFGGKTFKQTNGVWVDAAYRGQKTKNVSRGSGDYKKLDAGLRSIAENLSGTILVVWKEKAYRIE